MRFQVRTDAAQPVDADAAVLLDWFEGDRVRSTIQYEPKFLASLAASAVARDLFRLGGAVFCADKIALRDSTADRWTRELELVVPVSDPDRWRSAGAPLHDALRFLSGDQWNIEFVELPAVDVGVVQDAVHFEDAVSLFSGGLDSLAGVIDLLEAGKRLVLVGHHDSSLTDNRQVALAKALREHYGADHVTQRRLLLGRNAAQLSQTRPLPSHDPENTTRSRSFLFIAAGVVVADAIGTGVPLHIPENGFIGINVPLTSARAGSLSTRTTHPYFVDRMGALFASVELAHPLQNSFRLLTKGEALEQSANRQLLASLAPETISCSHPEWARLRHMPQGNCGTCYPCLIRRASLHRIGLDRSDQYTWDALTDSNFLKPSWESGASLRALLTNLGQPARPADVLRNGRIPGGETRAFFEMYCRGRDELEAWLRNGTRRMSWRASPEAVPTLVHTHCHVDRFKDPVGVLEAAEAAGVVTVAVTELPSDYQRLALRLGKRRLVRVALGLHPLRAAVATPLEMALFTRLLDRTDYVGEVGLDGSREGRATLRAQIKVLEHLLSQPRIKSKVLTVHSRGAERETIERLSQAGVTGILHWYSGALKHIDVALSAGLWFSVNPAMLRSQNGQRIVAALPPERVVTETDGPYSKLGRRPCEPKDIPSVVLGLARAWREEPDDARDRVFHNMAALSEAAHAPAAPQSQKPDGRQGSTRER